jgi:serine/threonine protein phosphatase 1
LGGIFIVPRHLAIGDIHGCFNALKSLVEFVSFRPGDTIVTLGDYVDRGPDSRAVLDFLIEFRKTHNHVALRGNHEIMMLDSRENKSWFGPWMSYGGDATLRSYASTGNDEGAFADVPDSHFDFLENQLVSFHECSSHFFVHAYADPRIALEDQSDASLYWRKYQDPERHCSDKIMVCGHTAQRSGLPLSNGHAVCIDTWAHGGGWLSCFDVESGTIWQANEAGDTRSYGLDEVS